MWFDIEGFFYKTNQNLHSANRALAKKSWSIEKLTIWLKDCTKE